MWRFIIYLLGLAALVLLTVICVKQHIPSIETDLLQRSSAVLRENRLTDWASVEIDGRDVSIRGEAPDDKTRQRTIALLQGVEGVRQVRSETAKHPDSAKAVKLPTTQVAPPSFPDPYQFKAEYDGHQLLLSGHSPSIENRSVIVKFAEGLFGIGNVSEQLTVTQGRPDYWQIKTIKTVLASLTHSQQATAELNNNQLTLSGTIISSDLKEQIQTQLKQALPQNFVSEFDIVVAKPVVTKPIVDEAVIEKTSPEVVDESVIQDESIIQKVSQKSEMATNCQQQFNQLLSETSIRFKFAQSDIDPVSMDLLDKLTASVRQCEQITIEIAGHTDSSGDNNRNIQLSHRRAEVVREALVSRGIEAEQLLVTGYGQNKPVADNSTPEGRALNRRIELNILED